MNLGLRGVRLPAGARRVVMRYVPASVNVGMFLTCVMTGLIAAAVVARRRAR